MYLENINDSSFFFNWCYEWHIWQSAVSIQTNHLGSNICLTNFNKLVSEFNEFEPRLKSAKNRFQLVAGLNLEKFNTILSGTNHFWASA